MLDPDIKVISQVEDARYDDRNERQSFVRVMYRVGKDGPFTARIDKTDNWHDVRDQTLNAEAAKVRIIGGVQS